MSSTEPVSFVAYSDYLCPWCYVASLRLARLEREEGARVEWRSYLLRPAPDGRRDLEKFRRYTESWRRPAAEPDAGRFRPWTGDAGPPSHSVPAHLVAKAAAEVGEDAFRRVHERLWRAYFEESRDVSDGVTLLALWRELGLAERDFERREDDALLRRVRREHEEALALGATGVPALRLASRDVLVTGALPYDTYRRWVEKERSRAGERAT